MYVYVYTYAYGYCTVGSWTVHQEGFSVVLSSLVWPGYYHYSTFLNGNYADIYCGTGKKNNDLGFML
ncbi:hypothetical protein HMI55_005030 [Coelomomyces lativittatus]|nr:hypothetical protein HMI55_005030 [Coelomomyces lativittatus]